MTRLYEWSYIYEHLNFVETDFMNDLVYYKMRYVTRGPLVFIFRRYMARIFPIRC